MMNAASGSATRLAATALDTLAGARRAVAIGALLAALAVAAGAFGAHGLRAHLSPEALAVFDTGARYHLIHALAMVAAGLVRAVGGNRAADWAAAAFALGIALFSGSLYALSLTGQRALGMVAPLGGLSFILGWLLIAVSARAAAVRR